MRILGADSFGGEVTSIDNIPVSYLKDKDMCILKTINIIYHYRYETNSFATHNIPNVIIPNDNISGDDGGRWILCDQFINTLYTNELKTNTINPLLSGDVVSINNSFNVSPSGSYSQGPITIQTDGVIPLVDPPLIVNSTALVENLNVQYLNGVPCNRFVLKENYNTYIQNSVDVFTVGIPNPPLNVDYSVYMSIANMIDVDPSIYWSVVTDKQIDRFTIKLSGKIDSPNYVLSYFIIGAFEDCGKIPEADSNYLLDSIYRYINDTEYNRFTV